MPSALPALTATVPTLIMALSDGSAEVRPLAASALGAVNPSAVAADPRLVDLLGDPDAQVRDKAAQAIGEPADDVQRP